MNQAEIIDQLNKCNEIAQSIQLDNNSIPYFLICEELKKMREILSFDGCCKEFNEYIKKECLNYIDESLLMSKEPVPEHIKKGGGELKYREHTLKQLKETASDCIRYTKRAYDTYCPVKI